MSVFTLLETICLKITAKPLPENARSLLLVDVRCSKTFLLELHNVSPLGLLKSNDRARSASSLFFWPRREGLTRLNAPFYITSGSLRWLQK